MGVGEAWDRAGSEANQPGGGIPYAVALGLAVAAALGGALPAAAQEYPANPYPQPAQQANPFQAPAQEYPANPFPGPAQPTFPTNPYPAPNTAPSPGQVPGQGAAPGGLAAPGQPPALNAAPGAPAPPGAAGAAVETPPPIVFIPALDLITSFTDNALSTPSQKQADVYETISPSIFTTADTARLNGMFSYNPQAIEYLNVTSQDQIIQNMLLNGTATLVPERFFFDAHAEMSEQSRTGDRGFGNPTLPATSTSTQTTGYSGSPYLQFHFGPVGDAELRYIFSQTVFSGNTEAISSTIPGQSVGALSNSTQNEGSLKFTSGEVFSRMQFNADADYQASDQSQENERHTLLTVGGQYAVTPTFARARQRRLRAARFPRAERGERLQRQLCRPYIPGWRNISPARRSPVLDQLR